jgi:hypothetical protein
MASICCRGQQLLSAAKLAEALDATDARGLRSRQENQFGEGRYHLSFWSVPYRTATVCSFQIPYMMGYGGNIMVLLPNGLSAFRFADGFNFDLESMVLTGEAIRPFPGAAGRRRLWRRRLCARHLRRATCAPRCPGTPSTGTP